MTMEYTHKFEPTKIFINRSLRLDANKDPKEGSDLKIYLTNNSLRTTGWRIKLQLKIF